MKNRMLLFYLVTAFFWFSLYAYVPYVSPHAEGLGANISLIGLIAGSYGFTQMLVRVPLGILSDITKKRKLFIILGIGVAIVSGLGMYMIQSKYAVLFFRGTSGVAAAAWVIYIVLFSSYFKRDESMKAVGYLNSSNAIGTIAALGIGGVFARRFGIESTFLLAAGSGFVALCLSFFIEENKEIKREPIKLRDVAEIARDKNLILVSALAVITQYLMFTTIYGFVPIVAKDLGADSFLLGLLSMTAALPGLFASPLAGTVLLKRFGAKRIIICGFLLAGTASMTIPLAHNLPLLYLNQLIGGCGAAVVLPLLMGLSIQNIEDGKRATAMGFFQAIYGLGMFTGPAVSGVIGEAWGLSAAFVVTGLIGFMGVLVARAVS